MKNKQEKSDPSIVAKRPANKPTIPEMELWASGAELAERREGARGKHWRATHVPDTEPRKRVPGA